MTDKEKLEILKKAAANTADWLGDIVEVHSKLGNLKYGLHHHGYELNKALQAIEGKNPDGTPLKGD